MKGSPGDLAADVVGHVHADVVAQELHPPGVLAVHGAAVWGWGGGWGGVGGSNTVSGELAQRGQGEVCVWGEGDLAALPHPKRPAAIDENTRARTQTHTHV